MKAVAIVLAISAAGLLGAGLFLGVFESRGECTITCRANPAQGQWNNSYGPYADFTRSRCEGEAHRSQVEGVHCQALFTKP